MSNNGNTYDTKPSKNHNTAQHGAKATGDANSSVDIITDGQVSTRRWYGADVKSICKQGCYSIITLNCYLNGQRITINITIGKGDNTTMVESGWLINPDGSTRLATPFAGFVK
jgi:hypothetical protein